MIFKQIPLKHNANCYILREPESRKGLIIDPGSEAPAIRRVLRKRRLEVVAVINTHGHFDHTAENDTVRELSGAPLWIHKADAFLLENAGLAPADRLLEEGDRIECGGSLVFEVIHTPGHSPGGIALYGNGVLISGDTLFAEGVGRSDFPYASKKDLRHSIHEKLLTLPDDTLVLPGHGFLSTIGEIRVDNPHLEDLE